MSDRPEFNDDFRDLISEFIEGGVVFLVVGSHAMAVHGVPRATGDIDLLVRPDRANALRVVEALFRFGAPIAAHGISADDFCKEGTVYQLGLPPRRIDILTAISGVSFAEAWQSRLQVQMGTLDVTCLGLQALLKNKRAAARPKDLVDVTLLEKKLA